MLVYFIKILRFWKQAKSAYLPVSSDMDVYPSWELRCATPSLPYLEHPNKYIVQLWTNSFLNGKMKQTSTVPTPHSGHCRHRVWHDALRVAVLRMPWDWRRLRHGCCPPRVQCCLIFSPNLWDDTMFQNNWWWNSSFSLCMRMHQRKLCFVVTGWHHNDWPDSILTRHDDCPWPRDGP